MSNLVTVTLSSPLTFGEGASAATYTELTFREAEVGDYIAADSISGDTAQTVAVLASMAGVPYAALKKMKMRDMNAIIAKTADLMGNAKRPAQPGG